MQDKYLSLIDYLDKAERSGQISSTNADVQGSTHVDEAIQAKDAIKRHIKKHSIGGHPYKSSACQGETQSSRYLSF